MIKSCDLNWPCVHVGVPLGGLGKLDNWSGNSLPDKNRKSEYVRIRHIVYLWIHGCPANIYIYMYIYTHIHDYTWLWSPANLLLILTTFHDRVLIISLKSTLQSFATSSPHQVYIEQLVVFPFSQAWTDRRESTRTGEGWCTRLRGTLAAPGEPHPPHQVSVPLGTSIQW